MARVKKRIDPVSEKQLIIFDLLQAAEQEQNSPKPAGSLALDTQFREALSDTLKNCQLSRYQVAARMSELTGTEITKSMLDSWTAESKENHRFPAIFLPEFYEATQDIRPWKTLSNSVKLHVMKPPDALRSEVAGIDEQIRKLQREKKKRQAYLAEIERR